MAKKAISASGYPMEVLTPGDIPDSTITVSQISDATDTGKDLLQATDDAVVRQQIGAMGTEGDQVIDGHLQVKEKLTITAPDPGAATWVTLLDIPLQDGTPGASLDYSHGADGSSFLRFCIRMADGTLRQLLLLSPRTGPNGQPGGIGLPSDSFLQVGNGYALDLVTDTGYAVYTAQSKDDARTAIGAGTSNLAIGTTATTAKAGNWKPESADLPAATTDAIGGVKMAAAIADLTAAPTQADFNGLLAALRATGILAS